MRQAVPPTGDVEKACHVDNLCFAPLHSHHTTHTFMGMMAWASVEGWAQQ